VDQGLHVPPSRFLAATFRPGIVTWNRLESRPRQEAFDRALRAEVRDPLWMLCRQWQFGEFRGEDAGSAVLAKVQVDTARINRYAGGDAPAAGYDDRLPLETRVEREPVPLDLLTRLQIGRRWLRVLARHTTGDHRALYVGEYPIEEPASAEEQAHIRSDQRAWQVLEAVKGRAVDGARLLAAIRSGAHQAFVNAAPMTTADRAGALAAAGDLETWLRRLYSQPDSGEASAWAPSYLEYRFACAVPADGQGQTQTVLVSEQYHHGHLDWYAFDVDDAPGARLDDRDGTAVPEGRLETRAPITFIPHPIEFAGMPNVRWWQLEDRQTDFGSIQASTTDLALLVLAEFCLVYGNDWSVVPYDLEVGSLCAVRGIVVTDVFGVRTFIRPAGSRPSEARDGWSMFGLSRVRTGGAADPRLFLAPTIATGQDSHPIERVLFTRDEMANMVWAIEDRIPGPLGRGVSGHEAATDLRRFLGGGGPPDVAGLVETAAVIRYRLGTTVPDNWIPFIPVRRPGSNREIRLQRAAMPRLDSPDPSAVVRPRGAILRPGLDLPELPSYFVNEEEVPRAGIAVTRAFQRARWWDGRVYTWLGRQKGAGRSEAASGLEFDRIVPKEGNST
jgi:hypothetical protein